MPTSFKNISATAGAWSLEILSKLANPMPFSWRYYFAALWGLLFGMGARQMRRAFKTNLKFLLHMDDTHVNWVTNMSFRNFAITLCDFFLPNKDLVVNVPDRKKLEEARAKHKGVLVLTFHMGHWELGARTMSQWGWPVTAVYQPYQNQKFKEIIEARRAPGVNFLPVGGTAANGVRAALKRGDVVAMLGDLPFGEEGVEVNLLGHRVMWPKGPVLLAVREKCPIVVAVVIRTELGHYTAFVEEPLYPHSKSREEVQRLVQEVADKFGMFLRQYPTQWYRYRPFEFLQ